MTSAAAFALHQQAEKQEARSHDAFESIHQPLQVQVQAAQVQIDECQRASIAFIGQKTKDIKSQVVLQTLGVSYKAKEKPQKVSHKLKKVTCYWNYSMDKFFLDKG